jgi:HK97 family phage portal protein
MGIFNRKEVRKKEKLEQAIKDYFRVLSAYTPVFRTFEGSVYEMEQTRAAIHAFANHASKLVATVKGAAASDSFKDMLKYQPNPLMNTSQYLYRIATYFKASNTSFIVPLYDKYGTITGFYPLNTDKCEIRQDKDGTAYLRYEIKDGVYAAIELERAGRMVNMQYDSEIFGASNRCMLPTMQMISQQSQSVLEGAKNAASLRFMARIATVLKPDQLKEERKRFNEENLGADNNNGVLLFDEKYEDVKQITSTPYAVPDAQMEQIRQNVFDYFGVNANILQNKFTSQEWEAFYEGAIEPFAVQLSQVHTGMVYSVRQVGFGNEILWTGDRLHHMSTQEKTTLIATLFDRGFITHNEGREILNLAPVEGGDKFYIRKEYAETGSVEDDGEGVLDSNTSS